MNAKQKFMEKLDKAMSKGWHPKDPLFIPKLECLPRDLFEEALKQSLEKKVEKK